MDHKIQPFLRIFISTGSRSWLGKMCWRGSLLFSSADYIWTSFRLWMSFSMNFNESMKFQKSMKMKFNECNKFWSQKKPRFCLLFPITQEQSRDHTVLPALLYFRSTSGRFVCTTLSAVVHYNSAALFSVSSSRSICSQIAHGHLRTRLSVSVQDHGPGNPAHQKNFQWSSSSIVLPLNVPYNHLMAPSETVSTSKSYYFCIKGHVGHGTDKTRPS